MSNEHELNHRLANQRLVRTQQPHMAHATQTYNGVRNAHARGVTERPRSLGEPVQALEANSESRVREQDDESRDSEEEAPQTPSDGKKSYAAAVWYLVP